MVHVILVSCTYTIKKRNEDLSPFAHEAGAVQVVDCVIGVTIVLKLDEGESVLQGDIPDPSKTVEELLDVSLASAVGNAPYVDSGRHPRRDGETGK